MPKDEWRSATRRDRAREELRRRNAHSNGSERDPYTTSIVPKDEDSKRKLYALRQVDAYHPTSERDFKRDHSHIALQSLTGTKAHIPPFTKLFTDAGIDLADIRCSTPHAPECENLQQLVDRIASDRTLAAQIDRLGDYSDGITTRITGEQRAQLQHHYAIEPGKQWEDPQKRSR